MKRLLSLFFIPCLFVIASCTNSTEPNELTAFRNLTGRWKIYESPDDTTKLGGEVLLNADIPAKIIYYVLKANYGDTTHNVTFQGNKAWWGVSDYLVRDSMGTWVKDSIYITHTYTLTEIDRFTIQHRAYNVSLDTLDRDSKTYGRRVK